MCSVTMVFRAGTELFSSILIGMWRVADPLDLCFFKSNVMLNATVFLNCRRMRRTKDSRLETLGRNRNLKDEVYEYNADNDHPHDYSVTRVHG